MNQTWKNSKNLVSCLISAYLTQIRATKFFFKNLAPSVTRYHGQLLSSTISEKTNDPILRKLTDGRTDGPEWRCPTNVSVEQVNNLVVDSSITLFKPAAWCIKIIFQHLLFLISILKQNSRKKHLMTSFKVSVTKHAIEYMQLKCN